MAAIARSRRYDGVSIALHWLTALLVLAAWLIGQTYKWFAPGSAPRAGTVALHLWVGVAVLLVVALRLLWRASLGRRMPPEEGGWMAIASHAGHVLLYALMIAVVGLGVALTWLKGRSVPLWGLVGGAPPWGKDLALARTIYGLHSLAANTLGVVAAGHALAALWHHYLLRDGVLRRMVPGLRLPFDPQS